MATRNDPKNEQKPTKKKFVLERLDLAKLLREAGEDVGPINQINKPKKTFVAQRINLSELLRADEELPSKSRKFVPQQLKFSQPNVNAAPYAKKSTFKNRSADNVERAFMPSRSEVLKFNKGPGKQTIAPKELKTVNSISTNQIWNLRQPKNYQETKHPTQVSSIKLTNPSPTDTEFIKLENLIMNEPVTPKNNKLSNRQKIESLLEEDKLQLFKYRAQMVEMTNEFVSMQETRHKKIKSLLNHDYKSFPLREIPPNYNMPNHKYKGSQSDGKILKRLSNNFKEDKGMTKALGLYNSMRSLSKSILNTPKMSRNSLATPLPGQSKQCASISKIIQKQCLMLHDTPPS